MVYFKWIFLINFDISLLFKEDKQKKWANNVCNANNPTKKL